jgi:hypothetical protein
MSSLLPDDLEIERLLVPVRVAVMDATHHVRSPRHSTSYRTARTLIFAGAAIAILTAGAIVVATERQTVIDHTAHCFEHASLDSRQLMAQGITSPDRGNLEPVAACATLWSGDAFNTDNDETAPGNTDHPVPELVACTYSDGIAAVFPREGSTAVDTDFCAALRLADWGSD